MAHLDELIERCIERWRAEGDSAVESICEDHPTEAQAIRRRLQSLRRTGMLRSLLGFEPPQLEASPPDVGRDVVQVQLPCWIGQFHVEEEVGRGGAGVVYRARDSKLERDVALKLLYWDVGSDPERLGQFKTEARIVASLQHPHVASIHSIEEHEGSTYLVLEFISGETLQDRFARGAVTPSELFRWGSEIASALEAAHEKGIVHRDLKPSNVMITPTGVARVLDFGLAVRRSPKRSGEEDRSSGRIVGTPRYMSPQQWDGVAATTADDIWSLGCFLFEGLSGRYAFLGESREELRKAVEEPPSWDRLPPSIPPEVRELILRCLSKDPVERPKSGESCEILANAARSSSALPRVTVQALRRSARRGDRVPIRVVLANPAPDSWTGELAIEDVHGEELAPPELIELAGEQSVPRIIWCDPPRAEILELPRATLRPGGGGGSIIRSEAAASIRVSTPLPAPVPGREAIDAAVVRALDRIIENSAFISVVGEPGSGKSTVLDRVASRARQIGVREISGSAAGGLGRPLKLFHDLLRDLLGVESIDEESEPLRRRVGAQLVGYLGHEPHTIQFLSRFLASESTDAIGSDHRLLHWLRLFRALEKEGPLWITIDDLHRADEESLALLTALLSGVRSDSLAIGFTFALAPDGRPTLEPFSEPGMLTDEVLPLKPLGIDSVTRWIQRSYPGVGDLDTVPWLPRVTMQRTEGNCARVHSLIEELGAPESPVRLFLSRGDRWSLDPEATEHRFRRSIPSFGDLRIARMMESLEPPERTLLEFAALMGGEFPVAVLRELVDAPEELDQRLDALEQRQWIEPIDLTLSSYRTRHPGFTDRLTEQMLKGARRESATRSLEIAAAAERVFGRSPEHAAWIGGLFVRGGRLGEALERWTQSLGWRIERGEYADALSLIEKIDEVRNLFPDLPARVECKIEEGRSRTLGKLGKLPQARIAAHRALALADRLDSTTARARILVQLSEVQIREGEWIEAEEAIREALELAESVGSDDLRFAATNNLGILQLYRRQLDEAKETFRALLESARREGERAIEAKALNNLGMIEVQRGRRDEARDHFRRAATLFERLGNLDHATTARVWLANHAFARGKLHEAEVGYEEAVQVYRLLQNRIALATNRGNLALMHLLLGRFDRAASTARNALELSRSIQDHEGAAKMGIFLAETEIQLGGDATTLEYLRQTAADARLAGSDPLEQQAILRAAHVSIRTGLPSPLPEPVLHPLSEIVTVAALQLLVEAERFGEALPDRWIDDARRCLDGLISPASSGLRLGFEIAFSVALSRTDATAARERLEAILVAPWLLDGCDLHAVHVTLARLFPSDGAAGRATAASQLEQQASRIIDPDARARYLAAREQRD